jgi:hypothetical protein
MRGIGTWLILTAVVVVIIAGVVDALRRSDSRPESARAGGVMTIAGSVMTESVREASDSAPSEPAVTTQPVTTEPQGTTGPAAIQSPAPERLPSCTTPQLALAVKIEDGSAMLVLRRVAGKPCHHGRSPIGLTLRYQSGHKVPLFGGSPDSRSTRPADFSHGFVQVMQLPNTGSCDPARSYLAVATVGPYVARRTVSGTEFVCNHG